LAPLRKHKRIQDKTLCVKMTVQHWYRTESNTPDELPDILEPSPPWSIEINILPP